MVCPSIIVYSDDGLMVNAVGFNPTDEITLAEVIRKYGNPDGVFIAMAGIAMAPPGAALLYYDAEGMVLHLPDQNSTTYDLRPGSLIEGVIYEERSEYASDKGSAQPWKGFGVY